MIDKIHCRYKVANDIHKYLIALLKAVQSGWKPPDTITETEYNDVRLYKDKYPDYYVGLVGFCGSFGAKFFGGYARGFKEDKITPRDIPNEGIRNLMSQVPNLKNIKFICRDYLQIDMSKLHNALIYCDIPYKGTTKYAVDNFDYNVFYNWCREVAKTNILRTFYVFKIRLYSVFYRIKHKKFFCSRFVPINFQAGCCVFLPYTNKIFGHLILGNT